MQAHVAQSPKPLDQLRGDLSADLVTLIQQMLAKDPADRPQAAEQVAARLERLAASADLAALIEKSQQPAGPQVSQADVAALPPRPKPQTEQNWIERQPIVATAAAALAMLLLGLWLGITITVNRPDGTTTSVQIPTGSTAVVDADGNIEITLPERGETLQIPKENVSIDHAASGLLALEATIQETTSQSTSAAEANPMFGGVVPTAGPPLTAEAENAEVNSESFVLDQKSPLFDQIEAYDYVDVIAVRRR
jgi:hypothetical protein